MLENAPRCRPLSGSLTGLPWPRVDQALRGNGVAATTGGTPGSRCPAHALPPGGRSADAPVGRVPAHASGTAGWLRPAGENPHASRRPGALARALAVACLLGVAGSGCGAETPAQEAGARLTPERFVEVYVELRRAARESPDTVTWEARKAEILRRHGTTPEALEAFADEHAADPAFLAALWDTIKARVEAADSGASK